MTSPIVNHAYSGPDHPNGACQHEYSGGIICNQSVIVHADKNQPVIEEHGWHGRAADAGSNVPCLKDGCGKPRLAKVHQGRVPVLKYPPLPVVEVDRKEASLDPAVHAWDSFSAEVRRILVAKSGGYGNAWQAQGYMGSLARVLSKTARIKNMLWKERPWLGTGGQESAEEQESVLDNAYDTAALLAFLVANIDDNNRWGS